MSKKIKLVIECDEFYVAESLRELGNMIENDDWNLETEPEVADGHYTAQVSVVDSDETTPSGKPYEIAEEKLTKFVSQGGEVTTPLCVTDRDGNRTLVRRIFSSCDRFWLTTCDDEDIPLSDLPNADLDAIEEYLDSSEEQAVVVEPESTDKAIFEFDSTFGYNEVMSFTRERCEQLCNDCEDRVTKYVITDTKSLDDVLNFSIESIHYSYRAFL